MWHLKEIILIMHAYFAHCCTLILKLISKLSHILSRTMSTASIGDWFKRHPVRAALASLLIFLLILDWCFPPPIPHDTAGIVVVARDGSPLRGWPDSDGVWRFPVSPEKVSANYLDALLTYEDRWFYWHPGVNPFALTRAGYQWLVHGQIVSGGSTLSMQVVRALEPVPRSLTGKIRQIGRALQLEMRLSKREILTLYLNHAPMGGIIEGVEMASRSYLGKSAAQLSSAEAALLVVYRKRLHVCGPIAIPSAPSNIAIKYYAGWQNSNTGVRLKWTMLFWKRLLPIRYARRG